MKITITEVEIREAVRQHILGIIQLKPGATVDIDFTSTRGADGIVATIEIVNPTTVTTDLPWAPDKSTMQEPAQAIAQDKPQVATIGETKPSPFAGADMSYNRKDGEGAPVIDLKAATPAPQRAPRKSRNAVTPEPAADESLAADAAELDQVVSGDALELAAAAPEGEASEETETCLDGLEPAQAAPVAAQGTNSLFASPAPAAKTDEAETPAPPAQKPNSLFAGFKLS